jgi:hypothetical protein
MSQGQGPGADDAAGQDSTAGPSYVDPSSMLKVWAAESWAH